MQSLSWQYRIPGFLIEAFMRSLDGKCDRCVGKRLDLAFDYYTDGKSPLCASCLIHAKVFLFLYDLLLSSLGVEKEKRRILLNEKYRKVSRGIVRGIANFGLRRPFVTGIPLAVVWNYTDVCNLKCSHCYVDSNSLKEPELTTRERMKIVDRLADAGIVSLNFSGGEPLMREDLFEVARRAHEKGIWTSISTNGTLITREAVRKLESSGITGVSISLDGADEATHNTIRNVKGSFDLAVRGVRNCVEYGNFEDVIVNTTLTRFSADQIPRIYDFVKSLGATRFYVSRILPSGRGKNLQEYDVEPEQRIKVLHFLYEKFEEYIRGNQDLPALARGMTYFSRVCDERSSGKIFPAYEILTGYERRYCGDLGDRLPGMIVALRDYFTGCAVGLIYCGIDPTGQVIPCAPASQIKLGSLLESDLEEIWTNNPLLEWIREGDRVKGKCSRCNSRDYCGGCRLTSFGLTGDWHGPDLSCPF